MIGEKIKFYYNCQIENLNDNVVGKAFLWYCAINKAYPKVIILPPDNAGYASVYLETRIDRTLTPGVFCLGVK